MIRVGPGELNGDSTYRFGATVTLVNILSRLLEQRNKTDICKRLVQTVHCLLPPLIFTTLTLLESLRSCDAVQAQVAQARFAFQEGGQQQLSF
jgi:hypothetical protein